MKLNTQKTQKTQKNDNFEESTLNNITLRVYPTGSASLSVPVDGGTFIIKGFIRDSKKGKFFAFPSHKYKDNYYNDVFTMGDDLRTTIEILINTVCE